MLPLGTRRESRQAGERDPSNRFGNDLSARRGPRSPVCAAQGLIPRRVCGDVATAEDDVTTRRSFAILDTVVGGQPVYLVDRPFQIVTSGVQGSLPLGTTLQRSTFIYYDHDLTVGGVKRGNPTIIDRAWNRSGQPTVLRTLMDYDVYGNRTVASSERDPNSPSSTTLWNQILEYDTASRTFPVRVTLNSPLAPGSALVTTIDYELPGCGAPLGLGRACRTTDPTGAAVATDSNALVQTHFYDGLLRTVSEERSGQGSAIARRFLAYDGVHELPLFHDASIRIVSWRRRSRAGMGCSHHARSPAIDRRDVDFHHLALASGFGGAGRRDPQLR